MNQNTQKPSQTQAGMVALAGRPNAGKSTLVNALVGEKVSIVTPKPQTTRHRIVGVLTEGPIQVALVDTPGLHIKQKTALNRILNETASASLAGIDLILFVVEASLWSADDERALEKIKKAHVPTALIINKIDKIKDKDTLLPFIAETSARHNFEFVVPLSARRKKGLPQLKTELYSRMPEGPFLFPDDEYTDQNIRFMVAETIREKLIYHLQQELPYSVAIEIESYQTGEEQTQIHACIWVSKKSHKSIVIGKHGAMLKTIGTEARQELVRRFGFRIDLRLWVKVRENWIDREASVHQLGH